MKLSLPFWLRVALLFMLAGFIICAAISTLYTGGMPDGFEQLFYCMVGLAVLLCVWCLYDIKGVTFQ